MKPPRMSKKVDMTPKRLQFMEEAECQSVDSGVDLNSPKHRYPTRACKNKISENVRPQSSKGKPLQATRPNSRKNCSDVDKENDGSLANGRQTEPKNRSSSQKAQKNSTKSLASQNRFKPEDRLMVQCCRKNCGKWRYTDHYQDPLDVPDIWYCDMHPVQRFASCKYPEELNDEETIENKYTAGNVVWAHLKGWPWWPAMVDDDPLTHCYYQLRKNSNVPNKYNMTYFTDDELLRSWLPVKDLHPYKSNPKEVFLKGKRMKYNGVNQKDKVIQACGLADMALTLPIVERCENYSFLARSRNGDNSYETESEDNETLAERVQNEFHRETSTQSSRSDLDLLDGLNLPSQSAQSTVSELDQPSTSKDDLYIVSEIPLQKEKVNSPKRKHPDFDDDDDNDMMIIFENLSQSPRDTTSPILQSKRGNETETEFSEKSQLQNDEQGGAADARSTLSNSADTSPCPSVIVVHICMSEEEELETKRFEREPNSMTFDELLRHCNWKYNQF